MSDPLETIVRPFQSGQISPARTYYPAGQAGVPNIKLQVGRNGSGKTLSGSYSESQSFYCAKSENEKRKPGAGGALRAFGVQEKGERHIIRIFGQDKTGTVQEDVWIDVERRDTFTFNIEGEDGGTKEMTVTLKWNDDPNQEQQNGRKTIKLKICAQDEEDYENPEDYVELEVIQSLVMREEDGVGIERTFQVDPDDPDLVHRKGVELRIHHRATNIDKAAESAFAKGDKTYRVDTVDYEPKPGDADEDTDDWVEFEVPQMITNRTSRGANSTTGTDVEITTYLRNEDLIEESGFAKAKLERTGPGSMNPPYRLDPFQNIVNVSFGGLAVEFKDAATR